MVDTSGKFSSVGTTMLELLSPVIAELSYSVSVRPFVSALVAATHWSSTSKEVIIHGQVATSNL